MDEYPLPAEVVAAPRSGARAKRLVLPAVYFAYRRETRLLHGAFLVGSCERVVGNENCTWTVARYVAFDEPILVPRARIKWTQLVTIFVAGWEHTVRHTALGPHTCLQNQFPECAQLRWVAWHLSENDIDMLQRAGGELCTLTTPVRFANAVHITPTVVECAFGNYETPLTPNALPVNSLSPCLTPSPKGLWHDTYIIEAIRLTDVHLVRLRCYHSSQSGASLMNAGDKTSSWHRWACLPVTSTLGTRLRRTGWTRTAGRMSQPALNSCARICLHWGRMYKVEYGGSGRLGRYCSLCNWCRT